MNTADQPIVGVLIVGHAGLPEAFVAAATHVLGVLPRPTRAVDIENQSAPAVADDNIRHAISALDNGAGVLILVDAMGATPFNAAARATRGTANTRLVTGLNLPMLIRVYNYPQLALAELAEAALAGGTRGIVAAF